MTRLLLTTGSTALWIACATVAASTAPATTNSATELCLKDGATIVAETAPGGAQRNVCLFPSGARINEWAYFRNKHRTTH